MSLKDMLENGTFWSNLKDSIANIKKAIKSHSKDITKLKMRDKELLVHIKIIKESHNNLVRKLERENIELKAELSNLNDRLFMLATGKQVPQENRLKVVNSTESLPDKTDSE
jgi:hypothetical protein